MRDDGVGFGIGAAVAILLVLLIAGGGMFVFMSRQAAMASVAATEARLVEAQAMREVLEDRARELSVAVDDRLAEVVGGAAPDARFVLDRRGDDWLVLDAAGDWLLVRAPNATDARVVFGLERSRPIWSDDPAAGGAVVLDAGDGAPPVPLFDGEATTFQVVDGSAAPASFTPAPDAPTPGRLVLRLLEDRVGVRALFEIVRGG